MLRNLISKWAMNTVLLVLLWSGVPGLCPAPMGIYTCSAQDVKPPASIAEAQGFWDKLRSKLSKNKDTDHAPQSVTERFNGVYELIHRDEIALYDSLSKHGISNWDRYQNIVRVEYSRGKDTVLQNNLNPGIKVFGWHPYWMGSAWQSYQFNLMSYLAWFSYNIDSTGHNDNPDVIAAWENASALVAAAKAKNCKVLLTITNHTPQGNRALLTNTVLQDELIEKLLKFLKIHDADGVDINFELVPQGLQRQMTLFIEKLAAKLKPKYAITLDLPAVGAEYIYELDRLSKSIDLFVMMGYDYYGPHSGTDGPVAPLDGNEQTRSIRSSVGRYLQKGVQRNQLIVAMPYYGAVWNKAFEADVPKFAGHITYRQLKAKYGLEKTNYDTKRWGAFYEITDPTTQLITKCWFDDTLTLRRKYNWVLEEKLAGVGIWALGYDNGYDELWQLIEEKYGADTLVTYKDAYIETKYFQLSRSVVEYRSLLAVAGIFIVAFLLLGLVIALFDWRVRDVFFQNKTLRLLYALAGIAILLFVYAFYLYVTGKPLLERGNLFTLGLGLVGGTCFTLVVIHYFEKNRLNMP